MAMQHERPSTETAPEGTLHRPIVQGVLTAIHNTSNRSDLSSKGIYGGAFLTRKVREKVINVDEMDVISAARDARKLDLTGSPGIPDDIPEVLHPTLPMEDLSPTAGLAQPPEIELSGRDRAANEHNQRREA